MEDFRVAASRNQMIGNTQTDSDHHEPLASCHHRRLGIVKAMSADRGRELSSR